MFEGSESHENLETANLISITIMIGEYHLAEHFTLIFEGL